MKKKRTEEVKTFHKCRSKHLPCGVRVHEIEHRPCNPEVQSSIPRSRIFIGQQFCCEYWCSSQEAELREIGISCKNLIPIRCKIDTGMFKLKTYPPPFHSYHWTWNCHEPLWMSQSSSTVTYINRITLYYEEILDLLNCNGNLNVA